MRPEIIDAFELLRSGDHGNLEQALALLQKTVFSFSMKVCGHREDAEDNMQEVLLKAIPYLTKFETPQALSAWLYTVVKNRCLMSRRKGKYEPKHHLSLDELMPDVAELERLRELAAHTPSPEKVLAVSEDTEQLKKAVLQLPPPYRLILVLHDVEELSTEDIARILNLKEGNVRIRLHRARLFVRNAMAEAAMRARGENLAPASTPASAAMGQPRRTGRCKRIFANLSNYLDGVLDDSLCQELERHMHGCEPCKAFLASLQTTISQTRKLASS